MSHVIYTPKGRAREYGDYALNIYDGCPGNCYYCFAPLILHKDRDTFHTAFNPRKDILEKVSHDLNSGDFTGKTIHLCFTCDPYPAFTETTLTRDIIKAIKSAGANVQILTKNGMAATRDFDLLGKNDRFGVTLTAISSEVSQKIEPGAELPIKRIEALNRAKLAGIGTWVSLEPVVKAADAIALLSLVAKEHLADVVKIGKMNYFEPVSPVNWNEFGRKCVEICEKNHQEFYIKDDLKAEMRKADR